MKKLSLDEFEFQGEPSVINHAILCRLFFSEANVQILAEKINESIDAIEFLKDQLIKTQVENAKLKERIEKLEQKTCNLT